MEKLLIDLRSCFVSNLEVAAVFGLPRILNLGAVVEQGAVTVSSLSKVGSNGCCVFVVEVVGMFEMSSGITV